MKWLVFLIFLSLCYVSKAQKFDLQKVRQLYIQAIENHDDCIRLIQMTKTDNIDTNALQYGYYAVAKILKSKFLINPISKYSEFNQGKLMLEEVISLFPNNLELRFLRYCIQYNSPSFLNYNQNLNLDKQLIDNRIESESKDLQSYIYPIIQSF